MTKSGGRFPMLLLLLACVAATWSASHGGASSPPEQEVHPTNLKVPLEILSSVRPIFADPRIQECWRSLLATESCVTSIFQSILGRHFGLSKECCQAIEGLGDYCVPKMFTLASPLGNLIPEVIEGVCAAPASPPPRA